jgi:hypothetical protein
VKQQWQDLIPHALAGQVLGFEKIISVVQIFVLLNTCNIQGDLYKIRVVLYCSEVSEFIRVKYQV